LLKEQDIEVTRNTDFEKLRVKNMARREDALVRTITITAGIFVFGFALARTLISTEPVQPFIMSTIAIISTVLTLQIFIKLARDDHKLYLTKSALTEKTISELAKSKGFKVKIDYLVPGEKDQTFCFDYAVIGKEKTYLIEIMDFEEAFGIGSSEKLALLNRLVDSITDRQKYVPILLIQNAKPAWMDFVTDRLFSKWSYITTVGNIANFFTKGVIK
jgi:hypothetical protein